LGTYDENHGEMGLINGITVIIVVFLTLFNWTTKARILFRRFLEYCWFYADD